MHTAWAWDLEQVLDSTATQFAKLCSFVHTKPIQWCEDAETDLTLLL
jgi:hypothetical protein